MQDNIPYFSNSHIDLCISYGNKHLGITTHGAYVMTCKYSVVNGFIIIIGVVCEACTGSCQGGVWVFRDVLHSV